jgi:hypothetical protein
MVQFLLGLLVSIRDDIRILISIQITRDEAYKFSSASLRHLQRTPVILQPWRSYSLLSSPSWRPLHLPLGPAPTFTSPTKPSLLMASVDRTSLYNPLASRCSYLLCRAVLAGADANSLAFPGPVITAQKVGHHIISGAELKS